MMHPAYAIETLEATWPFRFPTDPAAHFDAPRPLAEGLHISEDFLHVARLATVGQLTASLAHEVFDPLMLIRGHLRFIDEGIAADHPIRINFEAIDRASRRIEEMFRRMLDFSRKQDARHEAHDIAELVDEALSFVRPYLQDQHTSIQVHIAADLPHVEVDRGQIVQAMVNLLQNAADAMVNCEARYLSVAVTREDNDLRISVTDSGRGISNADIQRIFTPFFTTKGEGGSGLGLFTTRKIIEEHRGIVTLQTGPSGTTFVVTLPIHN